MFQHSAASPNLRDCPRTKGFLILRRSRCHCAEITPCAAWWVCHDGAAGHVSTGVALLVPHFHATHELVGRLVAAE